MRIFAPKNDKIEERRKLHIEDSIFYCACNIVRIINQDVILVARRKKVSRMT